MPSTVGVAMTTSTVATVSVMSDPRITSVAPWLRQPRISQAAMSNATLRIWPTRHPGRIPRSPGEVSKMLHTLRWVTVTPFGVPVVPDVNST